MKSIEERAKEYKKSFLAKVELFEREYCLPYGIDENDVKVAYEQGAIHQYTKDKNDFHEILCKAICGKRKPKCELSCEKVKGLLQLLY